MKPLRVGAPDFFERPMGGLILGMQDDQDARRHRVDDPVLASPLPLSVQDSQSGRKTGSDGPFQKGLPIVVRHPSEVEFCPNPRDRLGWSVGGRGVGFGLVFSNVNIDAAGEQKGGDDGTSREDGSTMTR